MGKKFLQIGMAVGGNYGCDAIVIGTERIIHKSFPDSEIWLPALSWRKRDYGKILGTSCRVVVKGNSWGNRVAILGRRIGEETEVLSRRVVCSPQRLIKQSDCVLSIGGDLYTFANKEKNWPFPYPIMEAGNDIIRQGKPYVIWCASVGPLEKAGDRLCEIADHLKTCSAIIVREQESFSYLRETIGLKGNVHLAADPAFLMAPEPFESPFLKERSRYKLLAVNFSLGPMQHVHGRIGVDKAQADLVALVSELLDTLSVRVLFVPHLLGEYGFLSPIYDALSRQYCERVGILPENLGARRTKWAVSQASGLLAMRFHCALAGFSTSTPTMMLVSTSKGAKICKEMYGNLEYGLDIGEMNPAVVISKIKALLDDEDAVRKKLRRSCEEMTRRALSAGDVLRGVL